jgi:hypothetical protein
MASERADEHEQERERERKTDGEREMTHGDDAEGRASDDVIPSLR